MSQYNADYPPQLVATDPQGDQLVKINGYVERQQFLSNLEEAERRMDE